MALINLILPKRDISTCNILDVIDDLESRQIGIENNAVLGGRR